MFIYSADGHVRAPNGENNEDVEKRVMDYFNRKIFGAKEEKVLIVSHHGPIVLLGCDILGMPMKNWRRLRLGNCGLCIITREGTDWRVKLWNSLSHFGLESYRPLLKREGRRK